MQFNTKSFLFLLFLFVSVNPLSRAEKNWHQAVGPNGNWQTEGQPPLLWSATRNENIRWRTPKPEAGMSNVTIWSELAFVTTHVPIRSVNVNTGVVEYLELPAQLIASSLAREQDIRLWGKGNPNNKPLNASGFAVGDKGHNGTGWGHISAARPTVVGRYLFLPVVTGTVYVFDTRISELSPDSLVAVNDLGVGGETWTLASLTFANGFKMIVTSRVASYLALKAHYNFIC